MLPNPNSAHDFDFLFGPWHIVNERLQTRLKGAAAWERFEADTGAGQSLEGQATSTSSGPTGRATTVSAGRPCGWFNPATGIWSISWADNVRFALFPPVLGRFRDGIREFFGEDVEGETPVRVRFRRSETTPTSIRWEQAFSVDGGAYWEPNWVMKFSRTAEEARQTQGEES